MQTQHNHDQQHRSIQKEGNRILKMGITFKLQNVRH